MKKIVIVKLCIIMIVLIALILLFRSKLIEWIEHIISLLRS